MTLIDLNKIDTLIDRLKKLPANILELRVKSKWEKLSDEESKLVYEAYKELDDILNEVLSFINVKFNRRKDLINTWNKIDFDPKINGLKIDTNSKELISESWNDGLHNLNSLMQNLKREIKLHIETKSKPKGINLKLEKGHVITLIGLIFTISVAFFGNNWLGRGQQTNKTEKSIINPAKTLETKDTVIFNSKLPFLESVPIIDKGLFVKHYYNDLIIGGINVDTLNINARTKNGEGLRLRRMNDLISLDITQEPFIEFEYKKLFYSIEILEHISVNCTIRKNINPTMKLVRYNEINE